MSRRHPKGFTLIEMLVALAIVAIGVTLAAPNITGFLAQLRLNAATRNLASDLRKAQSISIQRNIALQVTVDSPTHYYMNNPGPVPTTTPVLQTNAAMQVPGITIVGPAANPVFRPNALVQNPGTYTVNGPNGQSRTVTLWSVGRVTIP